MKVAIIGAGPAGLMAAYACERNGLEPVIYSSSALVSIVNRDMFLQRSLPGFPTEPDAYIHYSRDGSARGYARKVYGSADAKTSWDDISWGRGKIWWLREVYHQLWDRFSGCIEHRKLGATQIVDLSGNFPLTISTIPAQRLCLDFEDHLFASTQTWLVRAPYISSDHGTFEMTYNGCDQEYCGWFRYSRLRDWYTWEYARDPYENFAHELGPEPIIVGGEKMLYTTCTCLPNVYRVGRWARWQRGVLMHHAFDETTSILAALGLGKEVTV